MKALGKGRIEQSFPVTWFHLESGQAAYCSNSMFLVVQNEFLVSIHWYVCWRWGRCYGCGDGDGSAHNI